MKEPKDKILNREELVVVLDSIRGYKKIVFTNGCFDILHAGHVSYLFQAKKLGDILVVGINSDTSIKRIKGKKRPIIPEEARALLVASLYFVDYVTVFEEDTPIELIKAIKPHIHVKGGDYIAEELPEYQTIKDIGGEVKILPLLKGVSTTNIIEEIKKRYC